MRLTTHNSVSLRINQSHNSRRGLTPRRKRRVPARRSGGRLRTTSVDLRGCSTEPSPYWTEWFDPLRSLPLIGRVANREARNALDPPAWGVTPGDPAGDCGTPTPPPGTAGGSCPLAFSGWRPPHGVPMLRGRRRSGSVSPAGCSGGQPPRGALPSWRRRRAVSTSPAGRQDDRARSDAQQCCGRGRAGPAPGGFAGMVAGRGLTHSQVRVGCEAG